MEELKEKLLVSVERHKDEIYRFLAKVVGFDTTNYINTGKELACQEFIRDTFRELGASVELYTVDDVPEIQSHPDYEKGRGMEQRPNVTICIPCAPEYRDTAKSIMISSHTDTMPAGDLSQWESDPFTLSIRDGKAYGLGISDDKCGAGISYGIYRALCDCGLRLKHNLYLTMVADEEYFGGNGSLLACLKYPCDLYINLDGCDFEPQIAGLGGTCFELDAKYKGDTSTAEPVVHALHYAVQQLEPFGARRFAELEANPLYTGSEHAKSAYRLMEFGCGTLGTNVDLGKLKIVVYSTLKREELKKELSDRYETAIRPYFEAHGIESQGFIQIVRCMEYAKTENPANAYRLQKLMEELSGKQIAVRGACLSDLDIYLRNGSPDSFNVGLIREFKLEGGAHKPNEYIVCRDFENLLKALLLFVAEWCEAESEDK